MIYMHNSKRAESGPLSPSLRIPAKRPVSWIVRYITSYHTTYRGY
jgi:hypothetical protein